MTSALIIALCAALYLAVTLPAAILLGKAIKRHAETPDPLVAWIEEGAGVHSADVAEEAR